MSEQKNIERFNLSLQLWGILMTLLGCAFYLGITIATLTTKVENLKSQVDYIQVKVDSISQHKTDGGFLTEQFGGK